MLGVFAERSWCSVRPVRSAHAPTAARSQMAPAASACTDTVKPPDPDAFVAHYEDAMRDAGWAIVSDGDGFSGKGPAGRVRVDRLEGNDVGVYLLAPDDYPSEDQ